MSKYANFKVKDDSVAMQEQQQPSKTNNAKLEAIRKEQMNECPRPEKLNTEDSSFNQWSQDVIGALK